MVEMLAKFWPENLHGINHVEGTDIRVTIDASWKSMCWINLDWDTDLVVGFCEHHSLRLP
jgi:hypothetical protein